MDMEWKDRDMPSALTRMTVKEHEQDKIIIR